MIKTKVAFVVGRLLFSHSEQFSKHPKSSDWLDQSWPSEKVTFALNL